jgi:LPXTG-motif cell wall-anchored protein
MALGGLAAPAQAAPPDDEPFVDIYMPEQVTVIQGKTKTVHAELYNTSDVDVKNVVLKFGDVDANLGLTLPSNCAADSCQIGEIKAGARQVFTFTLKPTGDKVVSHFTASVGQIESEVTVVRSTGGVDLEVDPIDDMKLAHGQSADVPITVRNTGSEPVDSIGLIVVAEPGIETLTKYKNCVTEIEGEQIGGVICLFEQEFAPDTTFSLPSATPVKIKVSPDAGGPYTYVTAVSAIGVNDELADSLAAKTGPVLKLEERRKAADITDGVAPDDLNEEDNVALFGVTVGKTSADSAAVGGTFAGSIGDTKSIKVGVRNLGPTSVIPGTIDWSASIDVTIPAGVKLTEVDENCLPAGTDPDEDWDYKEGGEIVGLEYTCLPDEGLAKGAESLYTFTGTLTEEASSAGSVVVSGGPQDSNAGNDKAAITVKLTGGGQGGGDGGGLPVTGAPAGWVALGGALLLLAGGVAAYVFRRRRTVFVRG